MAARKAGESLVYKRLKKPVINELDPTDNPSAGDLWIDISQTPPILNMLDATLNAIGLSGAALTPPIVITGDGSTVTLTVGQPRGAGVADALDIKDTTDNLLIAQFSTATLPTSGAQIFFTNIISSTPALIVKQRGTATGTLGNVQFQDSGGNPFFQWDPLGPSILIGNSPVMGGGANTPGLLNIVKLSSGTADAFSYRNNAGTGKLFFFDTNGALNLTPTADTVPLIINGPAGMTANLLTLQVNGSPRLTLSQTGVLTLTPSASGGISITPTSSGTVEQTLAPAGFSGVFKNLSVNAVSVFLIDAHGNISFGDGTAAPTVGANQIGLGSTTATSANAGANGAVPAQVVGYLIVNIGGTNRKIPFFAT